MIIKIILTIILAILSGILGRLGGRAKDGHWYDAISHSIVRDAGCSLLSVLTFILWFGFESELLWLYLISFGLHWISLSSYWDWLFKFDNFFFAGFVTGLSILPMVIVYKLYFLFIIRSIVLAIIWGLLNIIKYDKLFIWRRDVAEEFLRYNSIILTYVLRRF